MDGGTDRGGELGEFNMQNLGGGLSGISEWDESMTGGDRNEERMARCGTMMSSLGWFICTVKGKQLLWAQLRVEFMFYTILSFSHLFSHIWMWFRVIFQALWNDSQTERLRNSLLLPEHDTWIQDVVADKVCTDKQNDSSEASLLHVLSSAWFCEMLPSVTILPCLTCLLLFKYWMSIKSQ